ncbi:Retinol dehydrogenase 12,Retinol dehydrogenase 13,Retinol dehydrogenase 11 [Mytilus edulis]|uniref:Retinol dehydrogenase 12,Retinol dehydrogenase 13,Retinol dehydrogenase 11 n=1 Tax=Mytilus edulis TaxID=6550 RepID=A0A8S3U1S9_MYTED|nr:Retinol dehydrogenase 12,Retinol dehydrogenase 13,Retinol dehydrogenase 11 [Mytilus edulis]
MPRAEILDWERPQHYELAKRNAKVIIACRNDIKGEAVARSIKIKTGNPFVYCSHLDLGNQRSIREFVQDFLSKESALHVLINNAAYMGPRATTDDGYERTFGVNYLGHFYLTYLLQDRLKKCGPSRIINIASDAIKKGKLDFDDLPLRNYDIYGAYARSKASLGMFTIEAHRRWFDDTVVSYAVHPGYKTWSIDNKADIKHARSIDNNAVRWSSLCFTPRTDKMLIRIYFTPFNIRWSSLYFTP